MITVKSWNSGDQISFASEDVIKVEEDSARSRIVIDLVKQGYNTVVMTDEGFSEIVDRIEAERKLSDAILKGYLLDFGRHMGVNKHTLRPLRPLWHGYG
jgi:hypothetical protein